MARTPNTPGICETCMYRSDCLYLRNSSKEGVPVLHCEEFDDSSSRREGEGLFQNTSFISGPYFDVKGLIPD